MADVVPKTAADQAGIRNGDIITALDDVRITNARQLRTVISQKTPGSNVRLTLLRDGSERVVTVALEPLDSMAAETTSRARESVSEFGLTLSSVPRSDSEIAQDGAYVVNVEPGSIAEDSGLKRGDVIVAVGGNAVTVPTEVLTALKARDTARPLLLRIRRGTSMLYAALG